MGRWDITDTCIMKKIVLLLGILTFMSSAYAGIVIRTQLECPNCKGVGSIETSNGKQDCRQCDGTGKKIIRK